MTRSHLLLAVPLLVVAFLTNTACAQVFVCDVTCTPDSTSSSFSPTEAARTQPQNARGFSSPIVARSSVPALAANSVSTVIGSQSYNYVIPILRIPGRAGKDLVLNLYYNSRIWTVDTVNSTATFNADRDFPSYGFRLDLGFLAYDLASNTYTLTEGDGTKHALPGPNYDSIDGTFIHYNNANGVLTYKNGTMTGFAAVPSQQGQVHPTLYRPYWTKDTNGNMISVEYVPGHDQLVAGVVNTEGRGIIFNYNASNQLISLTKALASDPGGVHTYATFTWGQLYTDGHAWYNFSGLATTAPALGTPLNVLTACAYANGSGYRFTYGDWAIINKIEKLSSTGLTQSYISYNYPPASTAQTDAPTYTQQTISPDGGTSNLSTWNYVTTKDGTGVVTSMAITDPNNATNTTNLDPATGLPSSVQVIDSSNTTAAILLRETDFTWTTSGASTVPGSRTTILKDTGQQSSVTYTYDSFGNPTNISEYDFGSALKRQTVTTYATGAYVTQHILNLPTQILVEDGAGKIVARTDLAYDVTPLTAISGAPNHDDQAYGAAFTTRGNLTSVTRYSNAAAGTGAVTRTSNYDNLGNTLVAQLGCCNQEIFNFSGATAYSAPDSIVRGPSTGPQFTTSFTYNPDNNLLLTSTDENGQISQYQYDSMYRATQVTLPPQNGTQVQLTTAYDDGAASPVVTSSSTANSAVTTTTMDGLGHVMRVDTKNGSTVVSSVTNAYDKLWRRTLTSNPYAPGDTVINTTAFSYDALGRTKQVTPPSAGNTQYQYSGNSVIVTDPAGKQRKSVTDALGRLIEVDEPGGEVTGANASGSLTINGTLQSRAAGPGTPGTGSVTLSGSEQSKPGTIGGPARVTVTIGGADSTNVNVSCFPSRQGQNCHTTNINDSGAMQFTVNAGGVLVGPVAVSYNGSSTTASLAAALFSAFPSNSVVSMSNPNDSSSFTLSTTATGSSTNSSTISASVTSGCQNSGTMHCAGPGWTVTPAQANFTGGVDSVPPSEDSGTCTVTVNGAPYSTTFGESDTTSTISSRLAGVITGAGNLVSATASGATISLTATTSGASTNYSLTSSCSYDSTHFTIPSFTAAASGSHLNGGSNGGPAVIDSGAVSITIGSITASTSYGASPGNSTAALVASALAANLNQTTPLHAVASGANITITYNPTGSAGNVDVSVNSSTSQPSSFSSPSFSSAGTRLAGGTDPLPGSLTTPYVTTYTYDVLDNLTAVSQAAGNVNGQPVPGQPRNYAYDSLGRLLTATTPESGTVTNYFTMSDGITACAGDPSLPCRVQDARGVFTTFTYDGINRPLGVTYSDGTPSVTYAYDTGGAASAALGRLTSVTEGSNSQTFTYDNFGRITQVSQVIDGATYPVQYTYNLAGQPTSITYPTGRVVQQSYDAIGRTSAIASGPTTYLSGVNYNAAGETLGLTLGNGVQGAFGYNDHLQLASLRYFKPGSPTDILNLGYDYGLGNNGQIQAIHSYTSPGSEDLTRSEKFTYDSLARLIAAQTSQVDGTSGTWSLQWRYDRVGNRLSQTLVGGNVSIGQSNFVIDPNTNRIANSGFTYDTAGNMTNDSLNAYSYDAANRLKQINAGPPTYTYFGALRIKKVVGSTTTVYVYSDSTPIVEYVNGSPSNEYIYSGSALLATIAGTAITYHHPDHLSSRAETDTSGSIVRTYGHFPFGDTWYETGTVDKWKFTSYEHDSGTGESGLDYAQFRYDDSGQGRFMSADSLSGSIGNPQSLNRYSYVKNDPINFTDPSGQCDVSTGSCYSGNNWSCLLDSHGDCVGGNGGGGGCYADIGRA